MMITVVVRVKHGQVDDVLAFSDKKFREADAAVLDWQSAADFDSDVDEVKLFEDVEVVE